MSNYRRNREGSTYFFTVVTNGRQQILTTDLGRTALRTAIRQVRADRPFRIVAIVLLPDHLHTVWELPRGDSDYSTRWRRIKSLFTQSWITHGGTSNNSTESRQKRSEQAVWQRRFFEHTCRDDDDLKRCVDYIHVNPLKHGLVEHVTDWPWSSFHRLYDSESIRSIGEVLTFGTAMSSGISNNSRPIEDGASRTLRYSATRRFTRAERSSSALLHCHKRRSASSADHKNIDIRTRHQRQFPNCI
jgi:putative transposase